jgi:glucokinase
MGHLGEERAMKEIVTADIGGTHVRFAIAELAEGKVAKLSEAVTLETADYASLQRAWTAFGEQAGRPLPNAVAISFAGPVHGEVLKLTNNPWVIRPAQIPSSLGVEDWTLINDFSAVGHAIVNMGPENFSHLCGPDEPLPRDGVISVIGPGTGLGVAHVLRHGGRYWVNETEGGHIDFAPLDALEDRIVAQLRKRYRRVSAERVVSGPGLANIYEVLRGLEGGAHRSYEDADLWSAALDGTDSLAVAALDRFCLSLGAVAGDIALAQGGNAVVIAGGIGLRLVHTLGKSGFAQRFTAKGRFEAFMSKIPVKMMTHPQPGLLGAAAAFAREHGE